MPRLVKTFLITCCVALGGFAALYGIAWLITNAVSFVVSYVGSEMFVAALAFCIAWTLIHTVYDE